MENASDEGQPQQESEEGQPTHRCDNKRMRFNPPTISDYTGKSSSSPRFGSNSSFPVQIKTKQDNDKEVTSEVVRLVEGLSEAAVDAICRIHAAVLNKMENIKSVHLCKFHMGEWITWKKYGENRRHRTGRITRVLNGYIYVNELLSADTFSQRELKINPLDCEHLSY